MDKALAQLEAVLHDQIAAHQRLLALLERKIAAMRCADHAAVAECCRQENREVQQVGEWEKRRLLLMAELTRALDPAAPEPLRLGDLAERLSEPARGRLLVLRTRLRERMEAVRRESAVAHRAAETLLTHMHGLMKTIGSVMTGIGVYGRGGALPRAATAVSTFSATA
jgi:hypothetical protein